MVICMKTTVNLADPLLRQAKDVAAREGTTVTSLIEEGLRKVLEDRKRGARPFRLRQVTFRGKGLQPGVDEGNWEQIRDLLYEGHGA